MAEEDWEAHKTLDRRIKRGVKAKKRASFREFADGLLRASPWEAATTINRIAKVKKGYHAKHSAVGKSLTPEIMTQYILET